MMYVSAGEGFSFFVIPPFEKSIFSIQCPPGWGGRNWQLVSGVGTLRPPLWATCELTLLPLLVSARVMGILPERFFPFSFACGWFEFSSLAENVSVSGKFLFHVALS